MKVILKDSRIVLVPEDATETGQLAEWGREHEDHVFRSEGTGGGGRRSLIWAHLPRQLASRFGLRAGWWIRAGG